MMPSSLVTRRNNPKQDDRYGFVPLVWETFGGATTKVHETFRHRVRAVHDDKCGGGGLSSSSLFSSICERISTHFQRCSNAQQMMRSRLLLPRKIREDVLQQQQQLQLADATTEERWSRSPRGCSIIGLK